MLSAVRIRNGMDRTNFINHIIFSSGQGATNKNKAGAGAIMEIFKQAGFISEDDGKILFKQATTKSDKKPITVDKINEDIPIETKKITIVDKKQLISNDKIQIILNVNINASASDLDTLPKKIKSLIEEINK